MCRQLTVETKLSTDFTDILRRVGLLALLFKINVSNYII
jgi:hypothetical protein